MSTEYKATFRLYPGAIHATEVIDFLGPLPGKLLVVWDGLPHHRARLSARSGAGWRSSGGRPTPRYSIRWSTSGATGKHHGLPNFCPRGFAQLSYQARRALRRLCLVRSFWRQAQPSL